MRLYTRTPHTPHSRTVIFNDDDNNNNMNKNIKYMKKFITFSCSNIKSFFFLFKKKETFKRKNLLLHK